ncbi:Lipoprotein NlpI [Fundidesulfovibrio magnetotacticus]|uniref:Lipoprotein NlpI n=1 Tax=Fundidesulfovibrio magnetotacticus TaxID=2730080 RepID=A0A6V8LK30_9BACT|nr:tetratricopeptide repeat protein [Fundidesulfovibrio magnetotacticus]GFK93082.1 Lipoprotein NlpI [Fundidesulfovibrio magnetotacticus]
MKKTNKSVQASPAMVRKQTATVLCVALFLAGVFMGWQGAVSMFAQQAAPPAGMPPRPAAEAPAQQGQQGNPMASPVMAQARALEEKAAKNPNDAAVWAELGNVYFDVGFAERAVGAYQKSLALKPGQPDVWTDMGVMQREMRQIDDALASFRQALEMDPKHQLARLNTGIVLLFDKKDKDGAAKAWKELLAINPQARMPDGKSVADALRELGQ